MRFMLNVKIDTTLKRSLSLPNRASQLKSRNQQAGKLLREMRSLGQLMWTGDKFKDKALGHADS